MDAGAGGVRPRAKFHCPVQNSSASPVLRKQSRLCQCLPMPGGFPWKTNNTLLAFVIIKPTCNNLPSKRKVVFHKQSVYLHVRELSLLDRWSREAMLDKSPTNAGLVTDRLRISRSPHSSNRLRDHLRIGVYRVPSPTKSVSSARKGLMNPN